MDEMSQQSAATAGGEDQTQVNPASQPISQDNQQRRIRVLIAKPGLDGHDRGAKVVTRGLRDAGMEVIYTGLHQTPEMIVEAALQEDVDAIGLSILSGAHNVLFPRIMKLLKENHMEDVLVFAGGIIPPEEEPQIKALGIGAVFGPGTTLEDTARYIRKSVRNSAGLDSLGGTAGAETWVDGEDKGQ
jgi:methylmalonyl-CoA mutase C-terminal domain/subunit